MLIIEKGKRIGQRLWKSHLVKTIVAVLLIFFSLDFFFPILISVPYSTIITARDGSILHTFLSRDDKWRMYAELNEITPTLRDAILFKEDKYFRYHPGFNPIAMLRAAARNLLTGRRTSGASTITMQTVRLLEPRERTYGSKLIELFRALQLEVHYSKDEILQLYLNLIPYGGNIEGLKSASLLYFGKPPVLLSLAELTTLTIIPNRPSSLRLGTRNTLIIQERNRWLARFRKAKLFNDETIDDAQTEPLTAYRREAPQLAPHLSRRLRAENPNTPIVHSTLNPTAQATTEQLVRHYADRIRAYNIHNSAVLIVDNQSREVVAYVGSADFGNVFDGGQVDGVRSVRSPGSALKPLLYGLAFDAGIITPKTKLADVPINFGGYEPDNYDRRFNGPVTAEFALANSLNIPAVALLKEIGTPSLVSTLQKAGFSAIKKQAKELGLSMILGGCGVTLEEMTRLYAGLANGGALEELHFIFPSPPAPLPKRERGAVASFSLPSPVLGEGPGVREMREIRLISPEAAYLVTHTLTQITRPDLPNNFDNSYHLPRIAWKTGTSYGRRDAWSIGYNQRYTVGVWVGNFSGVGVPELSGANTATPLLFQLFNVLDYNSPTGWFKTPKGATKLSMRLICPETGDVPGEFCQNPVTDYCIMGVSRYRHCQHRKAIFTNAAGTISYCAQCRPDSGSVRKSYPNLSPELVAFYQSRHIPFEAVPPHNPACERVFGSAEQTGPQIISLTNGSEYFINPKQPAEMELSCQAANDVQTVFWYLNDKLYCRAKPTEAIFFKSRPGALKISCADDKGRSSDIRILVRNE
ncbi:penicillin-binding protein 1C [Spirosoma sp. HMF4905]|uniref:peptidoglycan glycosyltransferase n=1 Tax=Spirosoma arboris TaxID=2682092 RepID=A0A7K1S7Y9_9BACT|nr:penicillin-binding protein 1C [Spirosoma arboris]MVM29696.1 penicillin-binding protein 1C [Spirosoma arboris]